MQHRSGTLPTFCRPERGSPPCVSVLNSAHAKVRDRIQKLLRLATSSNVHEAATAAAHARLLMERHRIEMAALQDEEPELTAHRAEPLWVFRRPPRWRIELACSIARTGGCRVYLRCAGSQVEAILVGSSSDASDVRLLDSHLSAKITKLCKLRGRGQGRHWSHAFRLGAVATIGERLASARRQAQMDATASAPSAAALCTVSKALARLQALDGRVDQWMANNLTLRVKRPRHVRADARAYAQGRVAGAAIALGGTAPALSAAYG